MDFPVSLDSTMFILGPMLRDEGLSQGTDEPIPLLHEVEGFDQSSN